MRSRVEELVGEVYGMWIMTFHAMCLRMLRYSPERLGYKAGFTVYDETDKKTLVKRICKELNIDDTGIMGYVSIPKFHVRCPIYHGVEESILQIAIGHLEATSLPVGGENTHTQISGHRGLPSARLFTDIDKFCDRLQQLEKLRQDRKIDPKAIEDAWVPGTVQTPAGILLSISL